MEKTLSDGDSVQISKNYNVSKPSVTIQEVPVGNNQQDLPTSSGSNRTTIVRKIEIMDWKKLPTEGLNLKFNSILKHDSPTAVSGIGFQDKSALSSNQLDRNASLQSKTNTIIPSKSSFIKEDATTINPFHFNNPAVTITKISHPIKKNPTPPISNIYKITSLPTTEKSLGPTVYGKPQTKTVLNRPQTNSAMPETIVNKPIKILNSRCNERKIMDDKSKLPVGHVVDYTNRLVHSNNADLIKLKGSMSERSLAVSQTTVSNSKDKTEWKSSVVSPNTDASISINTKSPKLPLATPAKQHTSNGQFIINKQSGNIQPKTVNSKQKLEQMKPNSPHTQIINSLSSKQVNQLPLPKSTSQTIPSKSRRRSSVNPTQILYDKLKSPELVSPKPKTDLKSLKTQKKQNQHIQQTTPKSLNIVKSQEQSPEQKLSTNTDTNPNLSPLNSSSPSSTALEIRKIVHCPDKLKSRDIRMEDLAKQVQAKLANAKKGKKHLNLGGSESLNSSFHFSPLSASSQAESSSLDVHSDMSDVKRSLGTEKMVHPAGFKQCLNDIEKEKQTDTPGISTSNALKKQVKQVETKTTPSEILTNKSDFLNNTKVVEEVKVPPKPELTTTNKLRASGAVVISNILIKSAQPKEITSKPLYSSEESPLLQKQDSTTEKESKSNSGEVLKSTKTVVPPDAKNNTVVKKDLETSVDSKPEKDLESSIPKAKHNISAVDFLTSMCNDSKPMLSSEEQQISLLFDPIKISDEKNNSQKNMSGILKSLFSDENTAQNQTKCESKTIDSSAKLVGTDMPKTLPDSSAKSELGTRICTAKIKSNEKVTPSGEPFFFMELKLNEESLANKNSTKRDTSLSSELMHPSVLYPSQVTAVGPNLEIGQIISMDTVSINKNMNFDEINSTQIESCTSELLPKKIYGLQDMNLINKTEKPKIDELKASNKNTPVTLQSRDISTPKQDKLDATKIGNVDKKTEENDSTKKMHLKNTNCAKETKKIKRIIGKKKNVCKPTSTDVTSSYAFLKQKELEGLHLNNFDNVMIKPSTGKPLVSILKKRPAEAPVVTEVSSGSNTKFEEPQNRTTSNVSPKKDVKVVSSLNPVDTNCNKSLEDNCSTSKEAKHVSDPILKKNIAIGNNDKLATATRRKSGPVEIENVSIILQPLVKTYGHIEKSSSSSLVVDTGLEKASTTSNLSNTVSSNNSDCGDTMDCPQSKKVEQVVDDKVSSEEKKSQNKVPQTALSEIAKTHYDKVSTDTDDTNVYNLNRLEEKDKQVPVSANDIESPKCLSTEIKSGCSLSKDAIKNKGSEIEFKIPENSVDPNVTNIIKPISQLETISLLSKENDMNQATASSSLKIASNDQRTPLASIDELGSKILKKEAGITDEKKLKNEDGCKEVSVLNGKNTEEIKQPPVPNKLGPKRLRKFQINIAGSKRRPRPSANLTNINKNQSIDTEGKNEKECQKINACNKETEAVLKSGSAGTSEILDSVIPTKIPSEETVLSSPLENQKVEVSLKKDYNPTSIEENVSKSSECSVLETVNTDFTNPSLNSTMEKMEQNQNTESKDITSLSKESSCQEVSKRGNVPLSNVEEKSNVSTVGAESDVVENCSGGSQSTETADVNTSVDDGTRTLLTNVENEKVNNSNEQIVSNDSSASGNETSKTLPEINSPLPMKENKCLAFKNEENAIENKFQEESKFDDNLNNNSSAEVLKLKRPLPSFETLNFKANNVYSSNLNNETINTPLESIDCLNSNLPKDFPIPSLSQNSLDKSIKKTEGTEVPQEPEENEQINIKLDDKQKDTVFSEHSLISKDIDGCKLDMNCSIKSSNDSSLAGTDIDEKICYRSDVETQTDLIGVCISSSDLEDWQTFLNARKRLRKRAEERGKRIKMADMFISDSSEDYDNIKNHGDSIINNASDIFTGSKDIFERKSNNINQYREDNSLKRLKKSSIFEKESFTTKSRFRSRNEVPFKKRKEEQQDIEIDLTECTTPINEIITLNDEDSNLIFDITNSTDSVQICQDTAVQNENNFINVASEKSFASSDFTNITSDSTVKNITVAENTSISPEDVLDNFENENSLIISPSKGEIKTYLKPKRKGQIKSNIQPENKVAKATTHMIDIVLDNTNDPESAIEEEGMVRHEQKNKKLFVEENSPCFEINKTVDSKNTSDPNSIVTHIFHKPDTMNDKTVRNEEDYQKCEDIVISFDESCAVADEVLIDVPSPNVCFNPDSMKSIAEEIEKKTEEKCDVLPLCTNASGCELREEKDEKKVSNSLDDKTVQNEEDCEKCEDIVISFDESCAEADELLSNVCSPNICISPDSMKSEAEENAMKMEEKSDVIPLCTNSSGCELREEMDEKKISNSLDDKTVQNEEDCEKCEDIVISFDESCAEADEVLSNVCSPNICITPDSNISEAEENEKKTAEKSDVLLLCTNATNYELSPATDGKKVSNNLKDKTVQNEEDCEKCEDIVISFDESCAEADEVLSNVCSPNICITPDSNISEAEESEKKTEEKSVVLPLCTNATNYELSPATDGKEVSNSLNDKTVQNEEDCEKCEDIVISFDESCAEADEVLSNVCSPNICITPDSNISEAEESEKKTEEKSVVLPLCTNATNYELSPATDGKKVSNSLNDKTVQNEEDCEKCEDIVISFDESCVEADEVLSNVCSPNICITPDSNISEAEESEKKTEEKSVVLPLCTNATNYELSPATDGKKVSNSLKDKTVQNEEDCEKCEDIVISFNESSPKADEVLNNVCSPNICITPDSIKPEAEKNEKKTKVVSLWTNTSDCELSKADGTKVSNRNISLTSNCSILDNNNSKSVACLQQISPAGEITEQNQISENRKDCNENQNMIPKGENAKDPNTPEANGTNTPKNKKRKYEKKIKEEIVTPNESPPSKRIRRMSICIINGRIVRTDEITRTNARNMEMNSTSSKNEQKSLKEKQNTNPMETVTATPSVKRRGRPRKSKLKLITPKDSAKVDIENIETTTLGTEETSTFDTKQESDTEQIMKGDSNLNCLKEHSPAVQMQVESPMNSPKPETTETPETSTDCTFLTPVSRKRGRKPKNILSTPVQQTPKTNSARKCPRSATLPFDSRLLLINDRSQLETGVELTNECGEGPIQCGLCLAKMSSENWFSHIAEHYGVGWKIGEDPQDTTKKATIINCATEYLKKVESMKCRICEKSFRSGIGIVGHIEVCGIEKITILCNICGKSYLDSNIESHQIGCEGRAKKLKLRAQEEENVTHELTASGRVKRASLLKAESKLKEIGEHINSVDMDLVLNKSFKYLEILSLENCRLQWTYQMDNREVCNCLNFKCKFEASELLEMESHFESCVKKISKPGYCCLLCKNESKIFPEGQSAEEHYLLEHAKKKKNNDATEYTPNESDSSTDDEWTSGQGTDEDFDLDEDIFSVSSLSNTPLKRKTGKRTCNVNRGKAKPVYRQRSKTLAKDVYMRWQKFINQYHSTSTLMDYALPNFATRVDVEGVLPMWQESMKFFHRLKHKTNTVLGEPEELEWRQLKRFESISLKDENLTFIGAPIESAKWFPLPQNLDSNVQFFALSYRKDFRNYISLTKPDLVETMLLVFKVTQNYKSEDNVLIDFHYAFYVKDGPIRSFDILPSGGYDKTINRLGLVAIAGHSSVNIYSLPLEVEQKEKEIVVIEQNPIVTLLLRDPSCIKNEKHVFFSFHCAKILWSETKPHNVIVGSLQNGCLVFWDIDITDDMNLNHHMENEKHIFYPCSIYYLGERSPKNLVMHYDTNGPRWLVASCTGRKTFCLDIRDLASPILLRKESSKSICNSLMWSPIWEAYIQSFGDVLPTQGRCSVGTNPLGIAFTSKRLENALTGINKSDYSELLNMESYGTENGDVVLNTSREMNLDFCATKNVHLGRVIWTVDIKSLDGNPLPVFKNDLPTREQQLYEDSFAQKYGVVFGPPTKLTMEKKATFMNPTRIPFVHLTQYVKIADISYNKNRFGKNLVLVGYGNGFVRMLKFNNKKFFTDRERNELI